MLIAIVQAGVTSSRLPKGVLEDIDGKPMLWHVFERVRRAVRVFETVVATSKAADDDPVASWCVAHDVPCYRGEQSDLQDMLQAARRFGADTIIRVGGDCPLVDPQLMDHVIARHEAALPYLSPNPADAKITEIAFPEVRERWVVTDAESLDFVREVYHALGAGPFSSDDVLRFLALRPELQEIRCAA